MCISSSNKSDVNTTIVSLGRLMRPSHSFNYQGSPLNNNEAPSSIIQPAISHPSFANQQTSTKINDGEQKQ